MKKIIFLILITIIQLVFTQTVYASATTVNLQTATPFAILGYTAITNVPTSVIKGNVGLSPASGSFYAGLTTAEVTGTIYAVDSAGPGGSVSNVGLLTTAKTDLSSAYTTAANETPATTLSGSDNQLGGKILTSGIYTFAGASTANLIGTLTLDGQGDSNSVFIFQASSDFVTNSASVVNLINGATACNVFWVVPSSVTFGTTSTFVGTIMAYNSITDNGYSNIVGRLLASNGTVALNHTTISVPTCTSTSTQSNLSLAQSAAANSGGGSAAPYCAPLSDQIVAPVVINSKRLSPTSISFSWAPYSGTNFFNVEYGVANGSWLYNTDVTGFSTTINDLPSNSPLWVRIAGRSDCTIGNYGEPKLIGGPELPNTGLAERKNNNILYVSVGALIIVLTSTLLILKKRHYLHDE